MARLTKNMRIASKESVNQEQFIDKCCERLIYRKSKKMLNVTFQLIRTKKPVCTKLGIVNPVKLNLSKDTLTKIKKGA